MMDMCASMVVFLAMLPCPLVEFVGAVRDLWLLVFGIRLSVHRSSFALALLILFHFRSH